MKQINLSTIGYNVKNLRESSGLSQHDFSIATEISKRSLANIESGTYDYKIKILDNILDFFNLEFDKINRNKMIIPKNFREHIITLHLKKKSNFIGLLTKEPNIVYSIRFKLLKDSYFNKPREVKELREFFKEFGWNYNSSSITNALIRMSDLIEIRKHDSKGNTNVYFKK